MVDNWVGQKDLAEWREDRIFICFKVVKEKEGLCSSLDVYVQMATLRRLGKVLVSCFLLVCVCVVLKVLARVS